MQVRKKYKEAASELGERFKIFNCVNAAKRILRLAASDKRNCRYW